MPPNRRVSDREPISPAEVARRLDRHEELSDEVHRDLVTLVRRLDERTDRISTRVTVIFAVVSVLWSLFLVIYPLLRSFLGL